MTSVGEVLLQFRIGFDVFLDLLVENPVALLGHADERVGFLSQCAPDELEISSNAAHADDLARMEQNVLGCDDPHEHGVIIVRSRYPGKRS